MIFLAARARSLYDWVFSLVCILMCCLTLYYVIDLIMCMRSSRMSSRCCVDLDAFVCVRTTRVARDENFIIGRS
jgi:hypothetical protein